MFFDEDGKIVLKEAASYLMSLGYRRVGSSDYCLEDGEGYRGCTVDDIALSLFERCDTDSQRDVVSRKAGWSKRLILFLDQTELLPSSRVSVNDKMDKVSNYMRVGGSYYKISDNDTYIKWDRTSFCDDFGRASIAEIPKFDGFCLEPDNINYQMQVGRNLNLYKSMSVKPKEGDWSTIEGFLMHIFGDQFEIGLDYLQLMYTRPKQVLPILCLVSEERHTGKSTFGNFLGYMFEDNATKISYDILKEKFNKAYASKLVAFLDESKISDEMTLEKIKDLSTAKTVVYRQMNMDGVEMNFYCKFVMMSNNTKDFVNVDSQEIRYWVREIPPISKELFEQGNKGKPYEEKLRDEVAAFKYFLQRRELYIKEYKSRMWFSAEDLETRALEEIKKSSLPLLHQEVLDGLKSWIEEKDELNGYCHSDGVDTRITARILKGMALSNKFSLVDARKGVQALFPGVVNKSRKHLGSADAWKSSTTCFELSVRDIEEKLIYYDLLRKEDSISFSEEIVRTETYSCSQEEIPF